MKDNKFGLGKVKANIEKMKRELPIILATKTQNYFTDSFKKGGWDGGKWPEPKRKIEGTKEFKYSKFKSKPTLVNRGVLRSAVNASLRTRTFNLIRYVVSLPYAKRHNEGLDMPKRKFMGDSPKLRVIQKSIINKYMSKLWQK